MFIEVEERARQYIIKKSKEKAITVEMIERPGGM